jgi:hypothetical protein
LRMNESPKKMSVSFSGMEAPHVAHCTGCRRSGGRVRLLGTP